MALACPSIPGCGASAPPELVTAWAVEPAPAATGATRVTIVLTGADGAPERGARLRFEGHMSHPGMAPVVADGRERSNGAYVADLRFTMAGDWTLVATGTLADGSRFTRHYQLAVTANR